MGKRKAGGGNSDFLARGFSLRLKEKGERDVIGVKMRGIKEIEVAATRGMGG